MSAHVIRCACGAIIIEDVRALKCARCLNSALSRAERARLANRAIEITEAAIGKLLDSPFDDVVKGALERWREELKGMRK